MISANFEDNQNFDSADDYEEISDYDSDLLDEDSACLFCPKCGSEVYEDANYCTSCKNYITPVKNKNSNFARNFMILVILAIIFALVFTVII